MKNVTPRSRSLLSIVFFLVGLIYAVWETRLLWHRFVTAVRGRNQ